MCQLVLVLLHLTQQQSLRSTKNLHWREPWGITVTFDGKALVSDWDKFCIHIFDASGKGMGNFGSANITTVLKYPAGIAIDRRSQVVVADRIIVSESGNHRISLFTANGKFLRCFRKKGTQPGMFQYPRHLV